MTKHFWTGFGAPLPVNKIARLSHRGISERSTLVVSIMNTLRAMVAAASTLVGCVSVYGQMQFEYEQLPIDYHAQPADTAITAMQSSIDEGELDLAFKPPAGYLESILEQLDISTTTQALVFSRTSLQLNRISPHNPRAMYFNDTNYVGWARGGDIEIISVDPKIGAVFYKLENRQVEKPKFERDRGNCLNCHGTRRTDNVPGPVVRSVFVDGAGRPHFTAGTFDTDHSSPFRQRWGGYYVTGSHGSLRHMGNVISPGPFRPKDFDYELGANRTDLAELVDTQGYPTSHSDIVALMVLEHQSKAQNLITKAHYDEWSDVHRDKALNKALQRPADYRGDVTKRRLARNGERLVRYLLFADEFKLTAKVAGTSGFQKIFSKLGPHDKKGRSLRELELTTRLFRYPCSYMIYSPAYRRLPKMTSKFVKTRLEEILSAPKPVVGYGHLSEENRRAILEILTETGAL